MRWHVVQSKMGSYKKHLKCFDFINWQKASPLLKNNDLEKIVAMRNSLQFHKNSHAYISKKVSKLESMEYTNLIKKLPQLHIPQAVTVGYCS